MISDIQEEHMQYKEFVTSICHMIQERLGPDITVRLQDILKNNDTHLDGLTILSDGCNLSPTIYLNSYFPQYRDGRSLSDICGEIETIYRENRPGGSVDLSFFTDYDKVKSRIIFRLINYERNRSLLKSLPHCRILDLAIVFCCLVDSRATASATILIHNHHLNYWKISTADLYALARENTPELLPHELKDMKELLTELFGEEVLPPASESQNPPAPMYVLSNRYRLNGSICILYPDVLKEFAGCIGSDFYILPSSVHEVLLLPAAGDHSRDELAGMVQTVNQGQLSGAEILSDHVYYYSRKTGEITM